MANTQGIIGAYSSVINYPYAFVTHFFLLYSKEELHFKKPRKTPESPLQGVYSRKMKTCLYKTYDCMWVCTVALLIINPTRKQPICLSTGEWINKSHHIHTIAQHYPITKRNKLLISNNTGESQMHYANWKTPDSKGYILCGSIYMTFWRRQNDRERKQISDWQGLELGSQNEDKGVWHVLHLFVVMVVQLYAFVTTHGTVH